jgi:3-hydroxyacyl-CoA dehydrogenase/enoyl-CoA hydratase/3-hydroxybutyryl-CoA epimerase
VLPPDLYARCGLATVAAPGELAALAREWLAAHRGAVNRNLDPRHAEPEPLDELSRAALFASLRAKHCVSPCKPYLAAALDAIEAGTRCDLDAALAVESGLFSRLMFDENSRSKMGLFFLARSIGPSLVKIDPARVLPLPRVAVLGAGLMGRGIAQVTADGGVPTLLVDVDEADLAASKEALAGSLERLVRKGTWSGERLGALLGRIATTTDYGALADVPLVIEAVPEDLALKRTVLARVQAANPRAIFATNTSAIPVEDIAEGSPAAANVVGMHYFSPVPLMPLLEVIRGRETSHESVDTAVWLGRKQKKTCVVVASSPGFYTSRLFGSFVVTGFDLAERGADPWEIDRAALEAGFPRGPFYMFGAVGSLVVYHAGKFMAQRLPARHPLPASIEAVVGAGFTGAGKRSFYRDEEGMEPDREAAAHIAVRWEGPVPTREELRDALLLSMVSEAFQAFGEGVVGDLVSMDLAAALGVGFPDCWQGPVRYVGYKGVGAVVRRLGELHGKFGIPVLAPPVALLRMERFGIDGGLI